MRKAIKVKKKGKTLRGSDNKPLRPIEVHLVVTRSTGDTERYKLAEMTDMRFAIVYRRALAKVKVPKRLGKLWDMPVDKRRAG